MIKYFDKIDREIKNNQKIYCPYFCGYNKENFEYDIQLLNTNIEEIENFLKKRIKFITKKSVKISNKKFHRIFNKNKNKINIMKKFEMTGSPKPFFKTKAVFTEKMQEFGWSPAKMTKKNNICDVLVCENSSLETNKMLLARELGIEVMTYEDIVDAFDIEI
jgi:hypothetical protein